MIECQSARPETTSPACWRSSFSALGEAFFVPLAPTPIGQACWVGRNPALARELGWTDFEENAQEWLQVLSGNQLMPGMAPLASVYSGHQFGVWAGQLGDGRAILLGETSGQEIQLKGAGLTPFSRMGDGRAVLRSSIREFLCSEAMQGLGIPTSRALCVTGSDLPVRRETMETAAVVTRVAPSFIRFGHFEHFSHHGQHTQLRELADYVIERFFPSCRVDQALGGNAYASLLQAVAVRTAQTVAMWQAVGFCHGVMNTDNMSILGLTLDYGPFQFLDAYDPGHICNHSDHRGRYAFQQQPHVAYWNLHCLGQAMLPLIPDQTLAIKALEAFKPGFAAAYANRMAAKLGFAQADADSSRRCDELLRLLGGDRVDYTIFWRRLSRWCRNADRNDASVRELFTDRTGIDLWLLQFSERITQYPRTHSCELMLNTNPKFVLRNHVGELAIQAARTQDYSLVSTLLTVLHSPYDEHPGCEAYADFPPDWAGSIAISCSS